MLWHGNWRNLEFKVAVLPASSPAAGVHEDNMPSNPKKKQKFHYRKKEKKKKKKGNEGRGKTGPQNETSKMSKAKY